MKESEALCEAVRQDFIKCCPKLPKPQAVTVWPASRKAAVLKRVKECGIETLHEAFEKAGASSFLCGENGRNWKANFDWILKPANLCKILENNYKAKNGEQKKTSFDLDEAVKKATLKFKK